MRICYICRNVCVCVPSSSKSKAIICTHTDTRTQRRTLLIRRVALFIVRFNQRHFPRFSISISAICVCLLPAARLSLIALFAFVSVSVLLVPFPLSSLSFGMFVVPSLCIYFHFHTSHKKHLISRFETYKNKIVPKIK